MTDYNDGKWHGWNGGECPVHPQTLVEVRYDDQEGKQLDVHEAGQKRAVRWLHTCLGKRIIAFRVVKEHREPREWWINPENEAISAVYHSGLIHVREVTE